MHPLSSIQTATADNSGALDPQGNRSSHSPPWLRLVWALPLLLGCAAFQLGSLQSPHPNELTAAEQQAGWILLFDGKSTEGWRGFGRPHFPDKGWVAEEGWLKHLAKAGGGDIITDRKFDDFELQFDWRIAPGANSGVKYFITESRGAPIGHEYQVIDDDAHADAAVRGGIRATASLYDALAPTRAAVLPAGSTNTSRIVIQGNRVEHWLNGHQVLTYELGSETLEKAKAASKFRNEAHWGTKFATPILLQDHGDEVWFRNMKLRELPIEKR